MTFLSSLSIHYPGTVTVNIDGVAASGASVIAMAREYGNDAWTLLVDHAKVAQNGAVVVILKDECSNQNLDQMMRFETTFGV